MATKRLIDYLEIHRIDYRRVPHSRAYTAQEVAAAAHIPGREIAKTILIKVEGRMVMMVLPATERLNMRQLRKTFRTDNVELASEQEFKSLFPECELGAMPPFGNLYGMEVYVSSSLSEDAEIAFNAGSHTEAVQLAYKDFETLVHPRVVPTETSI